MLSEDSDSEGEEDSEESVITYYFNRGFSYDEMSFLDKHYNCRMSQSTLLPRLKTYGLTQRKFANNSHFADIIVQVRQHIQELINGPASSGGYGTLWHTLEMEGLRVPRIVVQDTLKELDPEGTELNSQAQKERISQLWAKLLLAHRWV